MKQSLFFTYNPKTHQVCGRMESASSAATIMGDTNTSYYSHDPFPELEYTELMLQC